MKAFWTALLLEVIKTALSLLVLYVGWVFGQQVIAYWDERKKRNEIDIGSAQRFFELYGEFKAINRLWNTFCFNKHPWMSEENRRLGKTLIEIPDEDAVRWGLLTRAAAAESGVESLVLKLASERSLDEEQLRALGYFRQAYQKLRQAIRENEPLGWKHGSGAYVLFNDLAATFAQMISQGTPRKWRLFTFKASVEFPPLETARGHLKDITRYNTNDFDDLAKGEPARVEGAGGDSKDG